MKHLNLSPTILFTDRRIERRVHHRLRGYVPAWSFYARMEYFGHDVGKFFTVPVPKEIRPVRVKQKVRAEAMADSEPVLRYNPVTGKAEPVGRTGTIADVWVMEPDTFNIVRDEAARVRIVPAFQEQEGTLLFDDLNCGRNRYQIVEGRDKILWSSSCDWYRCHRLVFGAMLHLSERIVFRIQVWVNSPDKRKWGSEDQAVIYDADGVTLMNWKEFHALEERKEMAKQVQNDKWKLL